jgi:hypothetical protein
MSGNLVSVWTALVALQLSRFVTSSYKVQQLLGGGGAREEKKDGEGNGAMKRD